MRDVLGLLLLGVGGYFVYEYFFAPAAAPVATQTTTAGSPPTPASTAATLSVQNAATLPYNSAITSAQMQAINSAVDQNIQGGQVPVIAGNSVLSFMLGWGGASAGASKQAFGETYNFDGTNWNLQPAGTAGMQGYRGMGARSMTRAYRLNYVRRMA